MIDMTKQARTLDDRRLKQALTACRNPRETALLLLSARAGLRAVELAGLLWGQCDFSTGELLLAITKGRKPRTVPMSADVREALMAWRAERIGHDGPDQPVFVNRHAKPGSPLTAGAVTVWFHDFYRKRLGWEGYSSHSGRRTACTSWARKITTAGGSLVDVMDLMGHANLSTTQRYIAVSPDAKRRVVEM